MVEKKYWFEKILVEKKICPKKNLVGKLFWFEKLLLRINFAQKNLWSEKNLDQKFFDLKSF